MTESTTITTRIDDRRSSGRDCDPGHAQRKSLIQRIGDILDDAKDSAGFTA